ncbi:hypothetical protein M426DRAFT_24946 [Hypoxylon sp. CI-4A]|nr:hypothetical protein M426DRAFT_24946 [Hypoxylon sp. CI-4A]
MDNAGASYGPFGSKWNTIKRQYDQFQSDATAVADAQAYLSKTPDHRYALTDPKGVKKTTPFTDFKGPVYAENDSAKIIGNRSSFFKDQYPETPAKAGMSMIHILAIPKARIFNGVSLDKDTVGIIDEMVALFEASWAEESFRLNILQHQLDAIKTAWNENQDPLEPQHRVSYQRAISAYKELKRMIHDLTVEDFTYGLHLWPDHSVGHLHMHIMATPAKCLQYSTREHDQKTKDAAEVRDFITSRKT